MVVCLDLLLLQISSNLASEVHVTQSGHFISNKMVELCAAHFKLASTTVIGIPMKVSSFCHTCGPRDVPVR